MLNLSEQRLGHIVILSVLRKQEDLQSRGLDILGDIDNFLDARNSQRDVLG